MQVVGHLVQLVGLGPVLGVPDADDVAAAEAERVGQRAGLGPDRPVGHDDDAQPARQRVEADRRDEAEPQPAGLAALPTGAPKEAVDELQKRVREGFKGAVVNGHNHGRYLDNQFFWPILEAAEALNVPVYLHPTPAPKAVSDVSYGGFSPMVSDMLAGGAWGWHIETAVHMIRIVCGGVFDRFPKLQFVIGHMGEGLPFFFQRLDIIPVATTKLKKPISAYLKENVHYTFSGMNYPELFLNLLLQLGSVDRIMFSADYPYQSMKWARDFLDQIPASAADKERIAHGNAERLFKL